MKRPLAVHVMAKPSGAICNIDCTYCFYLEKEKLYPDKARGQWKMGDKELEAYVKPVSYTHLTLPTILLV